MHTAAGADFARLATKDDLARELARLETRLLIAMAVIAGLAVTVARFLLAA